MTIFIQTTFTKKILKAAAVATLLTGFANSVNALEITNPLSVPGYEIELFDGPTLEQTASVTPALNASSKIAVARLDQGRMICLLYTSPSPRDQRGSRMPSSA